MRSVIGLGLRIARKMSQDKASTFNSYFVFQLHFSKLAFEVMSHIQVSGLHNNLEKLRLDKGVYKTLPGGNVLGRRREDVLGRRKPVAMPLMGSNLKITFILGGSLLGGSALVFLLENYKMIYQVNLYWIRRGIGKWSHCI